VGIVRATRVSLAFVPAAAGPDTRLNTAPAVTLPAPPSRAVLRTALVSFKHTEFLNDWETDDAWLLTRRWS
jgi:hypothetical protein